MTKHIQNKFQGLIIDADTFIYKSCFVGSTLKDKFNIVNRLINDVINKVDCDEVIGYIGFNSKNSFRNKIYPEYKQNRNNSKRPEHLKEVSEYLHEYKGFNLIEGIEVDDACSITANYYKVNFPSNNYVVASNDKDLLQIPSYHYNPNLPFSDHIINVDNAGYITRLPNKKVFSTGLYRAYSQVLQGDSSDNIKGLPKMGEVGAYKLLSTISSDKLEETCLTKYELYYGKEEGKTNYLLNKNLCFLLTDIGLIPSYNWINFR
jgi:DNA polymerase-1